jgi:hypothetical protein
MDHTLWPIILPKSRSSHAAKFQIGHYTYQKVALDERVPSKYQAAASRHPGLLMR